MAKIAVIGSGYVGLVSGALLSDFGHTVICVDVNAEKIESLKKGIIPIYEPNLESIVKTNYYYKRLDFTVDLKSTVDRSEVIFIAVGTPPNDDGSADMQYVMAAAREIAASMNGYKIIVNKSTVPIGTGKKVKEVIRAILNERNVDFGFDIVSNPEFLREGSAVHDFTHPDRVVIGSDNAKALEIMKEIYRVLYINDTPFVETNLETAEMIKYASNAFLAMKIAYINEIANLCEKVGADVKKVSKAMGQDGRISPKFLHAGPGYGGSCFPKDTKALAKIALDFNSPITIIESAIKANEYQKARMVEKICNKMGNVDLKTIAILGVTFKPNTDDLRDSPSLVIIPELVRMGAKIKIYDPQGYKEGIWRFADVKDSIEWCSDEYMAVTNTDAIVVLTEWNIFRQLDFEKIKGLNGGRYFFDLRNIYSKSIVEGYGFDYIGVGV